MDKFYKQIWECFKNNQVLWRQHALTRMLERGISRKDVQMAVEEGEVIELYFDAIPFPGCLIFGSIGSKVLHVVVSINEKDNLAYILTAYTPDRTHFEDDLKTRKKGAK